MNLFPYDDSASGKGVRLLIQGGVVLIGLYAVLFAIVTMAMLQTPDRFGQFMRYAPLPVVWSVLPGPRIWMWARQGTLRVGDLAPDFTLPTVDGRARITLSSFRGRQPVVLVFGSYT